jgi:hypothetical protein
MPKKKETIAEAHERGYITGHHAATIYLLQHVLRELEPDLAKTDPKVLLARRVAERGATVLALRELCARHGDNDWRDDAYLPDVIEKHLGRHLG